MIYEGRISNREKSSPGEGKSAHKQLLHPQVNDTGTKREETGRVAAMGGRPFPTPAPVPPPAEAAPPAPLVFSPNKLPGEGLTNAAGSRSGRANPHRCCPAGACRGARPERGSLAPLERGGYAGGRSPAGSRPAAVCGHSQRQQSD